MKRANDARRLMQRLKRQGVKGHTMAMVMQVSRNERRGTKDQAEEHSRSPTTHKTTNEWKETKYEEETKLVNEGRSRG